MKSGETKKKRQAAEKIKAIAWLEQGYWKQPSIRLPTNALAAIASAEKFEYIGEFCRRKMKDLPPELQERVIDFQESHKAEIESPIISATRILLDPKGRVKLLPLGKPTKRDKQILFVLFCLAAKELSPETGEIKEVRGAEVKIVPTTHNQVWLSWDALSEIAMLVYGDKYFESVSAFINDLDILSHQEFLLDTPAIGGGRVHYRSILFSVAIGDLINVPGGKMKSEGVMITFGDLFFYENHSRYSMFDVKNMLNGLSGKNGDIFGNIVFSFARFLPAVVAQRKNGRDYKVSVPIKEIVPDYGMKARQNKYRIRKNIALISDKASKELQDGRLWVLGDEIKSEWVKKHDGDE